MEWFDAVINQLNAALGEGSITVNASLFFIVALTEMGVPFPFIMDATVIVTSFKNGFLSIQVAQVVAVVFLGRQFGSAIIYWLTRLVGTPFIRWMEHRHPTVIDKLNSLEDKFGNQAIWALAIARISSLNTVSSIACGALRFRYYKFAAGVALSSIIFDGVLVLIGSGAGAFLPNLSPSILVFVIIGTMAVGWGLYYFLKIRRKKCPAK